MWIIDSVIVECVCNWFGYSRVCIIRFYTYIWYISQFNCMTPSWWPCHKIVSVAFTHLHLHLLWVSNEPDNIKILSKSPILTARGAPYHIKGKIHRACVQRVSTCWAETGATMAENLKSVRNDRAYDGEMAVWSVLYFCKNCEVFNMKLKSISSITS